jgi:hypothetical protein
MWAMPGPEDWSIKQSIAHISETEPGLVEEALELVTRPGATIGHPPGALWGEAHRTANERPLAEIIAEFEAVNRGTLARVAALTDEALTKPGTHLGYGPVTVLSTLMVVLQHRRSHIFQNASNLISLQRQREEHVPRDAYADSGGSGPAVLLLDGGASRWDPVVPSLADGYRVLHYRYAALAGDIDQLCRDLDLRRPWIAGAASGAVDACKYALLHPDQVGGLVLVNLSILPFSRDGSPDDFSGITAPTLHIVGATHPNARQMEERGRQFPNGRVVVLPAAGRDVPREQPAAVAEAIRAFMPVAVRG